MFIFKECQGDSTKTEPSRYDGAQCLQAKSSFPWEITLSKATTVTRGCRHHSSIYIVDPIPTHRSGHEHLLTSTDFAIDNSVVPEDGLYS